MRSKASFAYHPRQDIQARQSLSALSVRAGSLVVLVRVGPKHWDRYGLKSWIEAAKKRLHLLTSAKAARHPVGSSSGEGYQKGRQQKKKRGPKASILNTPR
jgi:hypothetical protein